MAKTPKPEIPTAAEFLATPLYDGPIVDKRCICCACEGLNEDLLTFVEHRRKADQPDSKLPSISWAHFRETYLRPKYKGKLPATEKGIRNHAARHLKVEIPL